MSQISEKPTQYWHGWSVISPVSKSDQNHHQFITFLNIKLIMSHKMRFPTMCYVRPAKPQISLRICAVICVSSVVEYEQWKLNSDCAKCLHCSLCSSSSLSFECLTADPGVGSSIPARYHTFVEIDHEIISTVILLPSAGLFKKGCCQLQAKVCAQITG